MSGDDFGGTSRSIDELERMPYWQRCELLASAIDGIRAERARLKHLHDEAHAYLLDLMRRQDPPATVVDTDNWHVNIDVRREYTDVVEGGLDELQGYVSPDDYEQTVRPTTIWKVNARMLNVLRKRGGKIAEIIERAHVLDREIPTVKLTRKAR